MPDSTGRQAVVDKSFFYRQHRNPVDSRRCFPPIQLQVATYNAGIDDGTILVKPTGANYHQPSAITVEVDNGKKLTIKRANTFAITGDTLVVAAAANIDDNGGNYNLNVDYQGYTFQAFSGARHIVAIFKINNPPSNLNRIKHHEKPPTTNTLPMLFCGSTFTDNMAWDQ